MDYYQYPDYLMHYGVRGMKWGVRKKYYNSDGSLTRYGTLRSKRKSGEMSGADYRKAKRKYKADVRNQFSKIDRSTSLGQKLLWGRSVRKKAAENMVNKGMSREDAEKAAKRSALKSAVIGSAAYLGARELAKAGIKKGLTNYTRNQAVDAYSRARGGLNEFAGPSRGSRVRDQFKRAASSAYRTARSTKNRGKNKVRRNRYGIVPYTRQGPVW